MRKIRKTLDRILRGASDGNLDFDDLRALLKHLGFEERIRGSHHIFTRADLPEILNLQPRGGQAKPYQVRQVRGILQELRVVVEDAVGNSHRESQAEQTPRSGEDAEEQAPEETGQDQGKKPHE